MKGSTYVYDDYEITKMLNSGKTIRQCSIELCIPYQTFKKHVDGHIVNRIDLKVKQHKKQHRDRYNKTKYTKLSKDRFRETMLMLRDGYKS